MRHRNVQKVSTCRVRSTTSNSIPLRPLAPSIEPRYLFVCFPLVNGIRQHNDFVFLRVCF